MKFTGERFIPEQTDIELKIEHMNRYRFACQFVTDKRVLDAACGVGYGTEMLSKYAASVNGIDISQECIDYAQENYSGEHIHFQKASIEYLPFESGSMDVVVSFETLEHVDVAAQFAFLREIHRVLTPDGILIISTPNHKIYAERGVNPFHVHELEYTEFSGLLGLVFPFVEMFSQEMEVCNAIVNGDSGAAMMEGGTADENTEYMIAVCSQRKIKGIRNYLIVRTDHKYKDLISWTVETDRMNTKNNAEIKRITEAQERLQSELQQMNEKKEALLLREQDLVTARNHAHEKIEKLMEEKKHLQDEMRLKDVHIERLLLNEEHLADTINQKDREIAERQEKETRQELRIAKMKVDSERQDRALAEKKAELTLRDTELAEKKQIILNQEGHIALLLESDRELARIYASRSWRFMGFVWKVRDFLAPHGSKRRLFVKMTIKFVKHPFRFLRRVSPTRIRKFFQILKREGAVGVSRRLDDCLIGTQIPSQEIAIVPVEAKREKEISEYAVIEIPQWESPQVSIIIPAYNQFDFTYQCIRSIVNNSGTVSYEVILADDCSTDLTREVGQVIHGLVLVRNTQNLRFLRNCNHATSYAKGEYILFLNNDTQVQENWLAPLVELIERDDRIGMVGSKLVYPDGRLQEAGGILWKDGSAWNYGNRSDPSAPEFNYVKEVDYISGASIMIRKRLWEELGGFDERFAPAYCEDSDLAFSVRAKGYKVLYQPLSVVVHFEGVSNGIDTGAGQKAYQIENQKKFHEKWKGILEQEQFKNAENVFLARERGQNQKILFMVDHYVPQYDKDAGSRTVFQYLKLFVAQGYHVKFIGDNFYPHQPYTQVLQQMGVEVLYGTYYEKHWEEWLEENGASIGYAFLNRPHVSVKYIDEIRKKTKARIIYYGHDLHFLREQREYELTKDVSLLKSSQEWEKKELELMRKADVAYYPSCVEVKEIHRIAPNIRVKAIPAYLFTEVSREPFLAEQRKDMMFIGGFGHRPNVDAVKWLAQEIIPVIKESLPGVKVHILGSNPPEEVTALDDECLKIEGFVTDEQLMEYYQSCRIALVPLRYGAGIKGKVVEAMRYGIPVLTTSVGAEGIIGVEDILAIADTADSFAQKAISLYKSSQELAEMSLRSAEYIQKNFSPKNAVAVIGEDFDMEGAV